MEVSTRYHEAIKVDGNLADVLVKTCREAIDKIVSLREGKVKSFILQYDSYLKRVILTVEVAE